MPSIIGFLEYELDVANARLQRGSDIVPLRPKPLAVLHFLAERPDRLVTKDELLRGVWADTAVTDWALTRAVRELRQVLGDDARQPRIIETVHRLGYRFIAPIRAAAPGAPVPSAQQSTLTAERPSGVAAVPAIVGRHDELAVLEGCWQRALTGEREVVFIVGEAGMGKTTLVEEFLRRFTGSDETTYLLARGHCIDQHGASDPYLPVIEALGRLCGTSGAPLVDLLRRHAPAWLVQIPGLLDPGECEALERRLGTTTRERMLREMAALVAALPAPLVLILEDLHWSDHATLDLVSTLGRRRDPARLLVIGTYRPVEAALHEHRLRTVHHDLRARGFCRDLWLDPLSEVAVAEYLDARWPGVSSVTALARVVHEHTDGNALFLVNIADYLEVNGAIFEADGHWRLHDDAIALAGHIPQELRQLIATQIERVDETQRRVLEVGSLVGRRFSAALVASALGADVVEIEEHLADLSDTGLMIRADGASEWPDGVVAGAYRFNHSLYQSVLRDRVTPARRRQLHERIAARLELAYRGQLGEVGTELAAHFEASGQAERAVPYLEEAAARATRIGAHHEAVTLLESALAIVEPLPRTPERTLRIIRQSMELGAALVPARGSGAPQIEQAYERARRLSEESNDPVQLFQALIALTATYVSQARLPRAQETARQIEGLLPSMSIPPFVFAGSLLRGTVKYHAGDLQEARALFERAVSLTDVPLPPMSMDMPAMALSYLTLTLLHQGYPDQGRAMLETARRATALGRPFGRSLVAQISCFVCTILHDTDGLAAAATEAAALEDFPAIAAVGRLCHGRVLTARGAAELGMTTMREALDDYRATGQHIALPLLLANLAEGHAASGDVASALGYVAEARATAESASEIRYVAELHRLEGTLHAARGERSLAEQSFRAAIAVARAQGARWWELRAMTSRVRLTLDSRAPKGERRACRDELATVVASFSEGFDTPDLKEAAQLLERTPSSS